MAFDSDHVFVVLILLHNIILISGYAETFAQKKAEERLRIAKEEEARQIAAAELAAREKALEEEARVAQEKAAADRIANEKERLLQQALERKRQQAESQEAQTPLQKDVTSKRKVAKALDSTKQTEPSFIESFFGTIFGANSTDTPSKSDDEEDRKMKLEVLKKKAQAKSRADRRATQIDQVMSTKRDGPTITKDDNDEASKVVEQIQDAAAKKAGQVAGAVQAAAAQRATEIGDEINSIPKKVQAAAAQKAAEIGDEINSIPKKVQDAAKEKASEIVDGISGIPGRVAENTKKLVDDVVDDTLDAIETAVDEVVTIPQKAVENVEEAVSSLVDGKPSPETPQPPKVAPPSKDVPVAVSKPKRVVDDVITKIVEGLNEGGKSQTLSSENAKPSSSQSNINASSEVSDLKAG